MRLSVNNEVRIQLGSMLEILKEYLNSISFQMNEL